MYFQLLIGKRMVKDLFLCPKLIWHVSSEQTYLKYITFTYLETHTISAPNPKRRTENKVDSAVSKSNPN